jgi:antirestriction protein ArdC
MAALGPFRNANNYYATLLHEGGHWSGAEKRLFILELDFSPA